MNKATLLRSYDDHLRAEAEVQGALAVTRIGPLWLGVYPGKRGFVSYRDLAGADEAGVHDLVRRARMTFEGDPAIRSAEWKTRGHDEAPGLHQALAAHGFLPEEPESVMVGSASSLAVDVPLPPGVELRKVHLARDIRAMCVMQADAFGLDDLEDQVEELALRLGRGDGLELWVAEAAGGIVAAGRLEPVAGTPFAGLWGGATHPAWRGRGIYRALTAARARAALALGKSLLHSDSTELSRPILERSGMVKVTTTTPYVWRR